MNDALHGLVDEGEIVVCWVATLEVVGPDGVRYLAHRAGGGADGSDRPMAWTALGMLEASADVAKQQLLAMTEDYDEGDEES